MYVEIIVIHFAGPGTIGNNGMALWEEAFNMLDSKCQMLSQRSKLQAQSKFSCTAGLVPSHMARWDISQMQAKRQIDRIDCYCRNARLQSSDTIHHVQCAMIVLSFDLGLDQHVRC